MVTKFTCQKLGPEKAKSPKTAFRGDVNGTEMVARSGLALQTSKQFGQTGGMPEHWPPKSGGKQLPLTTPLRGVVEKACNRNKKPHYRRAAAVKSEKVPRSIKNGL